MEGLVSNITGACPLAFAGGAGAVFAQAVAAVVAAQCAAVSDGWPVDQADEIFRETEVPTYDFVIVGAGTAGSRLASRLSNELPTHSILLIEAGDDPRVDSEVPALFFMTQNSNIDWAYKTIPDENSCKGYKNNECIWSKGKGMGGSSSINAMLYLRGHPSDYNEWSKQGNKDWGYEHLLPYFERIEKEFNMSSLKHNEILNPLYLLLGESWTELGYEKSDNGSDEALIGYRINKLFIQNGKRLNTAKISLQSASQNGNLHVIKNTTVLRVMIDAESRLVRSVKVKNKDGELKQIAVRKEVILSAGSIATAQILILSGIGPTDSHLDVENIIDRPVGKNLQDHIMVPLLLQFDEEHSTELSAENRIQMLIEYMVAKTGPLSNIGLTDFMCFTSTKNETIPDVQFHHIFFPKNDEFILNTYLKGVGYTDAITEELHRLNKKNSLLGIYPTLLHPKSRGEILLTKQDPILKLVIKANYFHHPEDMAVMLSSIRIVQTLTKTSKFQELGIILPNFKIDACLENPIDSDSYWECYIKHMAATIYHPVGTAKMGPLCDENSVVNFDLFVHGMKNLRVVDASIMPSITGGNTMAPTLVIAEKAADIITNYYKVHDEL